MSIDKIQFRPGSLTEQVSRRGATDNATASHIAARDLNRYYALLDMALASVHLTETEANLLVDTLQGREINLRLARNLALELEPILTHEALVTVWGAIPLALLAKIRVWSLLQRMAICDAIERWRVLMNGQPADRPDTTRDESLVIVGLLR